MVVGDKCCWCTLSSNYPSPPPTFPLPPYQPLSPPSLHHIHLSSNPTIPLPTRELLPSTFMWSFFFLHLIHPHIHPHSYFHHLQAVCLCHKDGRWGAMLVANSYMEKNFLMCFNHPKTKDLN